jgi:hypothetical protein
MKIFDLGFGEDFASKNNKYTYYFQTNKIVTNEYEKRFYNLKGNELTGG